MDNVYIIIDWFVRVDFFVEDVCGVGNDVDGVG